jgi:hypothetical protein
LPKPSISMPLSAFQVHVIEGLGDLEYLKVRKIRPRGFEDTTGVAVEGVNRNCKAAT